MTILYSRVFLLGIFSIIITSALSAQEYSSMDDSLETAIITASRRTASRAGSKVILPTEFKSVISVTGESDIVKFVQTLPGVATGIEGSSSLYVRGGNMGNNLTTLDGIPLYGSTHLLGMTASYPQQIVSDATFRIGGFASDETNMTSSLLNIKTKAGDFIRKDAYANASNFIMGAGVSLPIINDRLSLIASLRISPLSAEFAAAKAVAGKSIDSLNNVRVAIYDIFSKLKWRASLRHSVTFSVFHSYDSYGFSYGSRSDDSMRWNNLILNLSDDVNMEEWRLHSRVAFNRFLSSQGVQKQMNSTYNNLQIVNNLSELTAQCTAERDVAPYGHFQGGVKLRSAWLSPGSASLYDGSGLFLSESSSLVKNRNASLTATVHAQFDIYYEDVMEVRAAAKLNVYSGTSDGPSIRTRRVDPEVNFFLKYFITRNIGVEGTYDRTVQFFHTLEGVPLGWSLDMIIPTDGERPAEQASQIYLGMFASAGLHNISLGVYEKQMKNLVYFADASILFSSAAAGWNENIDVGKGSSRGVEFLYEKNGDILKYRIAYTRSQTDRVFENINDGNPFPAKFDRKHVLNVNLSSKLHQCARKDFGFQTSFTYQSGNWETVAAGKQLCWTWGDTVEEVPVNYYSTINNYRLPSYVRWDIGCFWDFHTRYPQTLSLGIFNVLNRHNPFAITYDSPTREWKQISLIPIMPSISWAIKF